MGIKRKNASFESLKERMAGKDLDELLEEISVLDDFENDSSSALEGWSAVVTDEGIIAYFSASEEAFHFRLSLINRILNS